MEFHLTNVFTLCILRTKEVQNQGIEVLFIMCKDRAYTSTTACIIHRVTEMYSLAFYTLVWAIDQAPMTFQASVHNAGGFDRYQRLG